jgi:peptidoglycan/xylan/chitin deacetylase (PgdA/CDA1 family)
MKRNTVSHAWPLVLAYHSVSNCRTDGLSVGTSEFEAQISWLCQEGYQSITLSDFVSQPVPEENPIVIITFDDGYADNYWCALPILHRYGFVATIFLVSSYVNTKRIYPWDLSNIMCDPNLAAYQVLSWDQIREMMTNGIEFGSHTRTHPRLTDLSANQITEEIRCSRSDLEAQLGRRVVSFCYPHGNLNAQVIRSVAEAGYECAVVTPPRAGIPLNRYTIRRAGIYHHTTRLQFRLKCEPLLRAGHEHLKRFWRR